MSTTAEAPTLEALLVEDSEKALAKLAETLGAIVGEDVTCRVGGEEAEPLGTLHAAMLDGPDSSGAMKVVLDGRLVSICAGKLAMVPEEELSAASEAGEIPEAARGSIEELFRMLGIALGELSGGAELAPAGGVTPVEPEEWPGAKDDTSVSCARLVAIVAAGDKPLGCLALCARESGESREESDVPSSGETESGNDLSGWTVNIHGWPGDPLHLHLSEILGRLGAKILPFDPSTGDDAPASAALVVTRSAADLRIRLEKLSASSERPRVIVACSDRPTLQLVSIARKHGADDFLVLPGNDETLRAALTRTRNDG